MPIISTTNLTTGSVVRLRNFTRRGMKSEAMLSVDFKAPKGQHFVMLMLGAVPEDQRVTEDWLLERARAIGLVPEKEEP